MSSAGLLERPTSDHADWPDDDETVESRSSLDELLAARAHVNDDDARSLFEELADELVTVTRGLSSTRLAVRHPAYSEILAIGESCIPWILERLQVPGSRPIWLRLLGSLTPFPPGAGKETIPEAAAAWVAWGKLRSSR